jgi:hypothetical protein
MERVEGRKTENGERRTENGERKTLNVVLLKDLSKFIFGYVVISNDCGRRDCW